MARIIYGGKARLLTRSLLPWYLRGGLNPVDAWDAEDAGNYATSLIGLFAGTVLAEIGGGPVNWAAGTGWSGFVALNRCLDTGIIPASANVTAIVKYSAYAAGGNDVIIGARGASDFIIYITAPNIQYYNPTAVIGTTTPSPAAGIAAIAGKAAYLNGVDDGTIPAGAGAPGVSIYIGALNNGGVALPFEGAVAKFAFYVGIISPAGIAAIVAAM